MESTEIWTERLLLRATEEDDLHAFAKWLSDPETMQYGASAPHSSIEQTQDFLDEMIESPYNGVMEFTVCIPNPASGVTRRTSRSSTRSLTRKSSVGRSQDNYLAIGIAGLSDGEEMGFIFDRDHWGKGYATEAVDAIMRHVWVLKDRDGEGPKVTVVKADVDPRNTASLRLLQKFGFVKVGSAKKTFETHIGWCGSVYLEARNPSHSD